MTKVQLIRPPLDDWYKTGQLEELVSVPAGLCLLARTIRDKHEVEVMDGMNRPLEETLDDIDADIVGVTEVYPSHLNALEILRGAKRKGAITIIGGPNVNHLASRIIANHFFVDFAVVGDGEEALPMIAAGEEPEKIPNLVYRDESGRVVSNERRNTQLTTLFDLEDLANLDGLDISKAFPIASIRGCIKAELDRRCTFCSIDHKLKIMKPELVWKQIGILHEKYGIDYFWEGGDSSIVGNYLQKLLAARPTHLSGISFKIYSSPDQITPEIAETMIRLNLREIFVGVESVNDVLLEKAGKGFRKEDIERALEILEAAEYLPHGRLHLPFMYGLPGATPETEEETFRFAQEIIRRYPESTIVSSVPVPLAGTQLFENLRKHPQASKEYTERYGGDLERDDFFDYQALVRLQFKYFTSVGYDEMIQKVEETKKLVPSRIRTTSFDINR